MGDASRLIWVLMITSARNRPWPGDLLVEGYEEAGLPAPSVIRTAKIATAELSDATIVGQISANTLALVDDHLVLERQPLRASVGQERPPVELGGGRTTGGEQQSCQGACG